MKYSASKVIGGRVKKGQERGVKSTVSIGGQPVHAMLVPFPVAFLVALALSDLLFWWGGDPFWAEASRWLAVAGVATGLLAAVFGRIDFLTIHRAREVLPGWLHAGGGGLVLLLAICNLWLRLDDPVANIRPWGLALSLSSLVLLLAVNWCGGLLLFRHLVGAAGRHPKQKPPV